MANNNNTNRTNKTYDTNRTGLIPPHGGYKNLEAYKMAIIISDATAFFCRKWIPDLKQSAQMNGAARSGKQCLVEGSLNSGTSKKLELKLVGNARGSYGELLEDFEDFLRQRKLAVWQKDNPRALAIRRIAYKPDKSYKTYETYIENENPEIAANTLICLINQENYLLDHLLHSLEKDFLEKGGFTERLYFKRKEFKIYRTNMTNRR